MSNDSTIDIKSCKIKFSKKDGSDVARVLIGSKVCFCSNKRTAINFINKSDISHKFKLWLIDQINNSNLPSGSDRSERITENTTRIHVRDDGNKTKVAPNRRVWKRTKTPPQSKGGDKGALVRVSPSGFYVCDGKK